MVHIELNDGKMDKQRLLCSGHNSVTLVPCWLSWKFGNKSCRQIDLAQQSRVERRRMFLLLLPLALFSSTSLVSGHGGVLWPPIWQDGHGRWSLCLFLCICRLCPCRAHLAGWPRQVRSFSSEQYARQAIILILIYIKGWWFSFSLSTLSMSYFFCPGGRLTLIWHFCVLNLKIIFSLTRTACMRPFFYALHLFSVPCTALFLSDPLRS